MTPPLFSFWTETREGECHFFNHKESEMAGTSYHMSLSVRGALNWDKKRLKDACKWITKKDGTTFTPDDLREKFMSLLAEGKEVIPIGECDNFDCKEGCMGHPCKEGE